MTAKRLRNSMAVLIAVAASQALTARAFEVPTPTKHAYGPVDFSGRGRNKAQWKSEIQGRKKS